MLRHRRIVQLSQRYPRGPSKISRAKLRRKSFCDSMEQVLSHSKNDGNRFLTFQTSKVIRIICHHWLHYRQTMLYRALRERHHIRRKNSNPHPSQKNPAKYWFQYAIQHMPVLFFVGITPISDSQMGKRGKGKREKSSLFIFQISEL